MIDICWRPVPNSSAYMKNLYLTIVALCLRICKIWKEIPVEDSIPGFSQSPFPLVTHITKVNDAEVNLYHQLRIEFFL